MKLNLVSEYKHTKMPNLRLSLLALVLAVYITSVVGMQDAHEIREKRNVWQLGRMLECSTGRSWRDYNGYGCHCGIGGSGTPLDGTDRCCVAHDRCYKSIQTDGICPFNFHVYTVKYEYDCTYRRPTCSGISAYRGWTYRIRLASAKCRYRVCQCDSALASCVKSATFNESNKDYDRGKC